MFNLTTEELVSQVLWALDNGGAPEDYVRELCDRTRNLEDQVRMLTREVESDAV